MKYELREKIRESIEQTEKNTRYWVRRRYLRKDMEQLRYEKKELTPGQKQQLLAFWRPYTKHFSDQWHTFFYSLTGDFDVRYIPEDLMFTDIEGHFNDWKAAYGIDNKNNYQYYFREVKQPGTAFHKMRGQWHLGDYTCCSFEEALASALRFDGIVTKYAIEAGNGSSLRFWHRDDGEEALREIMQELPDDAIGQEMIRQHPALGAFNPSSVNSIRIVTFLFEGQVHVLAAELRMGQEGAELDNVSAGGLCCAIRPDGSLSPYGYDRRANKVYQHPCGIKFEGFQVPGWDKVVSTAKELQSKMGNFCLISWDFAVDPEENPVFIEMNLKYGGMKNHQLQNGPIFGDMTQRVLDEVYKKEKR